MIYCCYFKWRLFYNYFWLGRDKKERDVREVFCIFVGLEELKIVEYSSLIYK